MYSAFVKLTAVQAPLRFALFYNSIENPYLFSSHPRSTSKPSLEEEERLPFARLRRQSIDGPLTRFSVVYQSESFSARRVASLYIRELAKTPHLTGSIIHTSSSALKCHSPPLWFPTVSLYYAAVRETVADDNGGRGGFDAAGGDGTAVVAAMIVPVA